MAHCVSKIFIPGAKKNAAGESHAQRTSQITELKCRVPVSSGWNSIDVNTQIREVSASYESVGFTSTLTPLSFGRITNMNSSLERLAHATNKEAH